MPETESVLTAEPAPIAESTPGRLSTNRPANHSPVTRRGACQDASA